MNLITALEIFTNPYDLEFVIGEDPEKKKWGLMICRGPEHRGKLLLSGEGYDSKQDVINTIITQVLNICVEKGNEVSFGNSKNGAEELLKTVANPKNGTPEKAMNALTSQMVEQIKKQLEKDDSCSTCSWLLLLQKKDTFAIALTDWSNVLEKAKGEEAAKEMIKRNVPRLTQGKADLFLKKVAKVYA
ncbi:MAG: hypothetical protein V4504_02225 [Patescibacteria group bacterium]